MAYLYDLPNATGGIDNIAVQLFAQVPAMTPLLLFFTFCVVWLGGVSLQKTRSGTADYAMWAVVGSLSTFMLALLLSTITGLLNVLWLTIVIVITIFSGVWFFLDRKQSEV